MLTERYEEAVIYEHALHRAQTRKGTVIPYIAHLITVSALVIENGGTRTRRSPASYMTPLMIGVARRRFGRSARASGTVSQTSSPTAPTPGEPKPDWRLRKEAHRASLPKKPARSLLVSLADKVHNAEAVSGDFKQNGAALWSCFNGGEAGTIWCYRSLAAFFEERLPGKL